MGRITAAAISPGVRPCEVVDADDEPEPGLPDPDPEPDPEPEPDPDPEPEVPGFVPVPEVLEAGLEPDPELALVPDVPLLAVVVGITPLVPPLEPDEAVPEPAEPAVAVADEAGPDDVEGATPPEDDCVTVPETEMLPAPLVVAVPVAPEDTEPLCAVLVLAEAIEDCWVFADGTEAVTTLCSLVGSGSTKALVKLSNSLARLFMGLNGSNISFSCTVAALTAQHAVARSRARSSRGSILHRRRGEFFGWVPDRDLHDSDSKKNKQQASVDREREKQATTSKELTTTGAMLALDTYTTTRQVKDTMYLHQAGQWAVRLKRIHRATGGGG